MIEVVEYQNQYERDVKRLLVHLQEYLVSIDSLNIRTLTESFEEEYFKYLMNLVENDKGKIFLAKLDGKIVGFTLGYLPENGVEEELRTTCPKLGKVSKLIIDEECRKSGIGQKLINAIEDYLKSLGCEYVQIDVFGSNDNALCFYNKNGYSTRMYYLLKPIS